MFNTIELNKRQLSVTLHPATVIHADKYVDYEGFGRAWSTWGRYPFSKRLSTDVVFRSKENGRDWHINIENLELPIYTNQDVTVIGVDLSIVGYIDTQTQEYHYTVSDFAGKLDFGVALYKSVLLGLAVSILSYFLLPPQYNLYAFVPITVAIIFHICQRAVWNYRIEKALDSYLESN